MDIKTYYDNLSKDYDQDRFDNSYGRFIDQQERAILDAHLSGIPSEQVIDIACGTGRFMNYCGVGKDISGEMIKVAKEKHPSKSFRVGNVLDEDSELENQFGAALSFHLIMHLRPEDLKTLLDNVNKMLVKGGLFIFDLPSKERRTFLNKKVDGWHGANSYSQKEVNTLLGGQWTKVAEYGILFFPIHHFPKQVRPLILPLDGFFNRTFLKSHASYRVYVLKKAR